MKFYGLFLILLVFFGTATAQELVPNSDFENYNSCPTNFSSMPYTDDYSSFQTVTSWTTPVKLTTPDYLNDCATTSSGLKIPFTTFGYQLPHSGYAYGGIIAFMAQYSNGNVVYDYREYMQTKLLQPMKAGVQYCVSFYVSPTISANFNYNDIAIDEIGINFSANRPVDTVNRTISLPYHIKSASGVYFNDTSKWYNITGAYTATGGEEWLTLGTFFNGSTPNFINVIPPSPNPNTMYWNYLFIEDVSVRELTSADTVKNTWDTTVCHLGSVNRVFTSTNNADSYLWQDGSSSQQFTANDTGTYWCISKKDCKVAMDSFRIIYAPNKILSLGKDTANCQSQPITIGANYNYTYYSWNNGATTPFITVNATGVYILTASDTCGVQKDTVEVFIQPPTPAPTVKDTMICQYVSSPNLIVDGENLTWYYPNFTLGFLKQPYVLTDILGVQTFYVSQTIGKCESPKVPVNVTIKYTPNVTIGDYYSFCIGADTLLGHYYPEVSYLWNTGERTCCIYPRKTGTYQLTISNECGNATDTAFVEISPCDECLFVPTAFTPNGDGRNDMFMPIIKCPIYNYRLSIFNRWGELVFNTNNTKAGWNGNNIGDRADLGVYAYVLEYNSAKTKARKFLKGNITLIR